MLQAAPPIYPAESNDQCEGLMKNVFGYGRQTVNSFGQVFSMASIALEQFMILLVACKTA